MTRRDQIYKWCIYALGLFPIWVLDAFVLSRYPLLGITPTLLPLAVSAVEGPSPPCSGLAVWACGRLLGPFLLQASWPDRSLLAPIQSLLLGVPWMPLVYLIFRSIFRRVGGTRLA